jgi:hypothetical protein
MSIRPYFFFNMLLEISNQQKVPNKEYLMTCFSKLGAEDIQFYHQDIEMLFEKLDVENIFGNFREKLIQKLASRDKDIIRDLKALEDIFENSSSKDSEAHKNLLEDLDLFAFTEITVKGRKTNALVESLNRGFELIINYAF